jgi:glycosyltransferase involved in cell wall biosynthesis
MPNRMPGKISVIAPCFNEGRSIRANLAEISRFFQDFSERYEIVCVDDGSQDNTFEELQAAAVQDPNIKVVHYSKNEGKGFALRHGFHASDGDYVVFLDADLDLHPELLYRFFDILSLENADVVIGSKRHPESWTNYPKRRKIISEIYHWILLALFGLPIRDTQVGLKLFKREALERVFDKIICRRFALDVELLANIHRAGYKILEAPIKLNFKRDRRWGRVTIRTLRNTFIDTLAVFYRMNILKYYDLRFLKPEEYPEVAVIVHYDRWSPEVDATLRACLKLSYGKLHAIAYGASPPKINSDRLHFVRLSGNYTSLVDAMKSSPAEVVAFIREGSVPCDAWLEKACRNLGTDNIVAVSGPTLPTDHGNFWSDAGHRVLSSVMGCGGFRYRYIESLHQYIHTITTENLIIRKDDLIAALHAHGFDSGVETWLGQYLNRKAGRRIVYDPEVAVYTQVTPLFLPYLAQVFDWGRIRGVHIRRNPAVLLRWRDAGFILPSLLVLLMLVTIPLVFATGLLGRFCLSLLGVYLLLVLMGSFSTTRLKMNVVVLCGIVSTHAVYGVACISAILLPSLSKVKPVAVELKH